jgi:hypothetical protein
VAKIFKKQTGAVSDKAAAGKKNGGRCEKFSHRPAIKNNRFLRPFFYFWFLF